MPILRRVIAIIWLALLLPQPALAEPPIPPLTGRVVDRADVIDAWTESQLSAQLERFEHKHHIQLVVVTLPSLGRYTIEDWGLALGRGWGIGQKGKNDGVLLVVAPKDRQLRIEVGYGLEGALPDAAADRIVRGTILPRFRAGDLTGGISAGVDAIIAALGGQGVAAAPRADQTPVQDTAQFRSFAVILGLFFFVAAMFALNHRRRTTRWGAPYMYYGGWPGGRAGGRGGIGSGGGFSGGGGSFGGGGASGKW
jgi:uncharacterized protein